MIITTPAGTHELPDSVTVKQQMKSFVARKDSEIHMLHIRWDDSCNNGYNHLRVITAAYYILDDSAPLSYVDKEGKLTPVGALTPVFPLTADEFLALFPEVGALAKYHLMAPQGPLHYFANTVFLAGELDCWGYRKGEQRRSNTTQLPLWRITWEQAQSQGHCNTIVDSATKPFPDAKPWLMEGKDRELISARKTAIWPEATDEDLCLPQHDLINRLHDRLPGLVFDLKGRLEAAGFTY